MKRNSPKYLFSEIKKDDPRWMADHLRELARRGYTRRLTLPEFRRLLEIAVWVETNNKPSKNHLKKIHNKLHSLQSLISAAVDMSED